MSLTLLQAPAEINLTRNQILVRLEGMDSGMVTYGYTGASSRMTSNGSYSIPAGFSITITWTEPNGLEQSRAFLSVNTLIDGPYIPSAALAGGYISNLAYWEAIAAIMQAHLKIAPHFRVYATSAGGLTTLNIEVKEYNTAWSLTSSLSGLEASNVTVVDAEPETNYPDNYKCHLDVFFETELNAGTWDTAATLAIGPTADGIFIFDIAGILDQELRNTLPAPPIPAFTADEPFVADTQRRFALRYYEIYDGLDPITADEDSTTYLALCGGISRNTFADYGFFANLGEGNSLLTWYPDGKSVALAQPEWLAWYNYTGAAVEVILEVIRYTAEGALTTYFLFETVVDDLNPLTAAKHQVVVWPVGFDQMGIVPDAADVLYYTVRVVDADSDYEGGDPTYLSQPRRYYLDRAYYENTRYLMYLNGFCCPETLRCTGNLSNRLNVVREESTRQLPADYTGAFRETFQFSEDFANFFVYRTGYLSRFEADALQELLIYNNVWEVYENGYIPLYVRNREFPIHVDRQYLYSFEIETLPALARGNYSNTNIPLGEDQESWQTAAAEYWRTVYGQNWQIA